MRISKTLERWFKIPQDPDNGEILIVHLRPGEVQEILTANMTQEFIYEQGDERPRMIQRQNPGSNRDKQILSAVRNWKNFYDEDGKKMKCDEANVIKAIQKIDGFVEFVSECREKLAKDAKSDFEEQKKI